MAAPRFFAACGMLLILALFVDSVGPRRIAAAQTKELDQKRELEEKQAQEKKKADETKVDEKKADEKKVEEKKSDEPVKKKPKDKETPKKEDPKPVDPPKPEEPVDPIKVAHKMLAEAKIKEDPATLIEFFKTRTLTPEIRKNLAELIAKLGNDDFDVREDASQQLNRAGLAALPILRAAGRTTDVEVTRRIDMALKQLVQENESGRVVAAATILAHLKVENTPQILIDYMPCIPDDDTVQEGLRTALIIYTRNTGKADKLLVDAITSKDLEMRSMAAQVLGEASAELRPQVKKLLLDPEAKVRYYAGLTLAKAGDKSTISELLKLLTDGSVEYAYLTEDLMFQLLGDGKMAFTLSGGDVATRKKCRDAWEAWWKENEAKVDLVKLTTGEPVKGLTLIVEVDQFSDGKGGQGRVWECGPDGKQRWEWGNVNGPVDIQVLNGGKFLVAEYYTSQVTERDREGKVLWTQKVNGNTVAAQRLANGNTLVASMNDVAEYKRDGTKVGESYPRPQGTVYYVRQAKNGHTWILAGNELAEYDTERKLLRSINIPGGLSGWGGFDFLPNGNFLISYYGNGRKYAEIDAKGKVVYENVVNMSPSRVQRLRNGNVLISGGDTMNVVEYDRDKKEVWKVATKGRPFSVLRY